MQTLIFSKATPSFQIPSTPCTLRNSFLKQVIGKRRSFQCEERLTSAELESRQASTDVTEKSWRAKVFQKTKPIKKSPIRTLKKENKASLKRKALRKTLKNEKNLSVKTGLKSMLAELSVINRRIKAESVVPRLAPIHLEKKDWFTFERIYFDFLKKELQIGVSHTDSRLLSSTRFKLLT